MRKVRGKTWKKRRIILPLCLVALIIALVGLVALAAAAEAGSGRIIRNVYVDGVRIGGMETAEAVTALENEFAGRSITVSVGGEERTFTLEELGMHYKTDAIVGQAYDLGKNGSFAENVAAIFRSFFTPTRLSSSEALVGTEPGQAFYEYIESLTVQPTESAYVVEGDKVVVTNGINGREVDAEALLEQIGALTDFDTVVEAPVNIIPFTPVSADDIYTATASDPHAPYGRNSDGNITATVRTFNLDVAREIQKNNPEEGAVYEFVIDTESVAALGDEALYPDVLGEMTTEFSTSYTTRAHNIRLATGLLNGATLLPGETFSFNGHNGEITTERGYQVAEGYANGTVVDSVGAGVCQLSSTLYNAVLYANMEIVSRSNHSLPVSYLPLGQDAAISYPYQDFRFRNNTDSPVKIFASVDGGSLTVQLRGQSSGDFTEVEIENNTLSVIEPETREVADEGLAPGERVVEQNGSRGYVVESFRVVYKDGVEISRENLGRSTYKAQDTIINVGKEAEESE